MKILFCSKFLNSPRGGAEISALTLIRELSKRHNVCVFSIANSSLKGDEWKDNMELFEYRFTPFLHKRFLPGELRELIIETLATKELDRICKRISPDLVISQGNILFPISHICKKIMFVVDFGSSISNKYHPNFLIKYINFLIAKLRRRKLEKIDLIINRSKYMANLFAKKRIKSEVVAPFINVYRYKFNETHNPRFITFLRPRISKGVEIVEQIAKRMPNKEFLIVGRIKNDIKKIFSTHFNIKFLEWCNSIEDVYSESRVLIMPSVWNEPFGRIPIEAGINGIPTIASNRGGLPEAVGEGGILIDDIWNIDRWVEAIKFLNREEIYQEYSEKARKNAERFNIDKTFKELRKIVREKLDLEL